MNNDIRVKDVDSEGISYEHNRKIDAILERFPELDREQEDNDVVEYQKTKDLNILTRVYENRIPTLKAWASKNYYPGLVPSVEDLFAELAYVLVKAADKYDSTKGSFNTLLFTFFLNRIKNLKSSRYAKKRQSIEWKGAIGKMILSIDLNYKDSEGGNEMTLKDTIASEPTKDKSYISKNIVLDETIRVLSNNDPLLKSFFVKLSEGDSMASLLKEYRTKQGEINIGKQDIQKLKKYKCNKIVSEMVKEKISGDFKLIEYKVEDHKINYKIEMKKTDETDKIIRAIRAIKKNKNNLMYKISGPEMVE